MSVTRSHTIHLNLAGDVALPRSVDETKVRSLETMIKRDFKPIIDPPKPISKERIQQLSSKNPLLSRYVGEFGVTVINGNPRIVKSHLSTTYNVDHGGPTDQKSSGRCWIFGLLNMMRIHVMKEYGKEFAYSSNFVAFWDKWERANHFLEKMIEMKDEEPSGQRMMNAIEQFYADGGEWELFLNIVEKYGVVPDYVMQETKFAGQSGGYMSLLQGRLREIGGILHKKAKAGATREELDAIKDQALKEVYSILTKYLGVPPKNFLWKDRDGKVRELTPLQFYKKNPVELKNMVHVTHLPNRSMGSIIEVRDVGNVVGGVPMRGLNLEIEVILKAIVAAVKDGAAVPCGTEIKELDREKNVFSLDSDQIPAIFGFDSTLKLSKGDRLNYQATKIAHLMNVVGCDELDAVKVKGDFEGDVPDTLGPLLKVENSWNGHQEIFMTIPWVKEYFYDAVIPMEYLPQEYQQLWRAPAPPIEYVDAWDPFGRI